MLLLAIDTSTTAITVALHDGSQVVAETTTLDARGHAEHLAPGIAEALSSAGAAPGDLTAIACGLGPGPFTGLRVGIVTGRTMALATGARLLGVCSLDALAAEASGRGMAGELLVATDARRKEVYWARYTLGYAGASPTVVRLTDPAVTRPGELPPEVRGLPVAGRGAVLYPEAFGSALMPPLLDVSAAWLAQLVVARLAAGEPVDEREPFYLRRPDAVPSAAAATAKSAIG